MKKILNHNVTKISVFILVVFILIPVFLIRQEFFIKTSYGGDLANKKLVYVHDYSEPLAKGGKYYIHSEIISQDSSVVCINKNLFNNDYETLPGVHEVELSEDPEFQTTFLVNASGLDCLDESVIIKECSPENTLIKFEISNKESKTSTERYGCFDNL